MVAEAARAESAGAFLYLQFAQNKRAWERSTDGVGLFRLGCG